MEIEVKDVAPLSRLDIEAIELHFGVALLPDIIKFYEKYNGGRLRLNELSGTGGMVSLSRFISAEKVVGEIKLFGVESGFIPIAWSEGGNYIVVRIAGGEVYFIDHEDRENYILLANSIPDFLSRLVSSEPLTSSSAGSILQIDPDFLRRIQAGDFK